MTIFMKVNQDLYDEHNSSKMRRRGGRTCQNGKTSWSQDGSSRHVSGDSPTRKARAAPYLVKAIILAIINDYRVQLVKTISLTIINNCGTCPTMQRSWPPDILLLQRNHRRCVVCLLFFSFSPSMMTWRRNQNQRRCRRRHCPGFEYQRGGCPARAVPRPTAPPSAPPPSPGHLEAPPGGHQVAIPGRCRWCHKN